MGGVGEALAEVILVVVERAERAAKGRVQKTRFEETQSDADPLLSKFLCFREAEESKDCLFVYVLEEDEG